MKLLASQTDEASLAHLGEEAVALLLTHDFQTLAERFGYALAFGRHPATAIEEEWQACITKFQASPSQQNSASPSIVVKYFKHNNAGLFAVVECVFITQESCPMLAELIVSSGMKGRHVFLEEISLLAA